MIWGYPYFWKYPYHPFKLTWWSCGFLWNKDSKFVHFWWGIATPVQLLDCPCLLQKVSHGFLTICKKFTTKCWCESTKWNGMRTTTTTTGVDKKTGGDVSQLGLLGMWWKCLDANSLVMKQWWKWPTITSFCSFKVWTEAYLTSGNRPPCIWWHLHLPSRGR